MKDSTTNAILVTKLVNGDEVSITPSGCSVTGTVTDRGLVWTDTTGTTTVGTTTVADTGTITVSGGASTLAVPYGSYPYTSPTISPHFPPSISPYVPYAPYTFQEPAEEYFEPPRCGKCRTDVSIVQSFIERDTLIMVFTCHGERRRVDISLKRFKGNEEDAKAYLLDQIDWLFCEEDDWRELTPMTVVTPNADRDAVREWLTH